MTATRTVNDLVETLETLVDSQQDGLLHILTALELMCGEKAAHIEANWQDEGQATNGGNRNDAIA
jgi:hypothetical protein